MAMVLPVVRPRHLEPGDLLFPHRGDPPCRMGSVAVAAPPGPRGRADGALAGRQMGSVERVPAQHRPAVRRCGRALQADLDRQPRCGTAPPDMAAPAGGLWVSLD